MDWAANWSNENILQLLELYKEEPCLWDPRTRTYKNRGAHLLAWHRILDRLPFKTTLEEAKKKKNSLMGYYRIHLNRYKKTLSITGGRGVYHTTWFAFDLMHSFLKPIYGPKKKKRTSPMQAIKEMEGLSEIKSEPRSGAEDSDNQEEMYTEEFSLDIHENNPLIKPKHPEVKVNEEDYVIKPLVQAEVNETVLKKINLKKVEKVETSGQEKGKLKTAECSCTKNEDVDRKRRHEFDECDHFGYMIASKIRKINSTPEREILMNSIQNLVFETYMKCRNISKNEGAT